MRAPGASLKSLRDRTIGPLRQREQIDLAALRGVHLDGRFGQRHRAPAGCGAAADGSMPVSPIAAAGGIGSASKGGRSAALADPAGAGSAAIARGVGAPSQSPAHAARHAIARSAERNFRAAAARRRRRRPCLRRATWQPRPSVGTLGQRDAVTPGLARPGDHDRAESTQIGVDSIDARVAAEHDVELDVGIGRERGCLGCGSRVVDVAAAGQVRVCEPTRHADAQQEGRRRRDAGGRTPRAAACLAQQRRAARARQRQVRADADRCVHAFRFDARQHTGEDRLGIGRRRGRCGAAAHHRQLPAALLALRSVRLHGAALRLRERVLGVPRIQSRISGGQFELVSVLIHDCSSSIPRRRSPSAIVPALARHES